MEMCLKCGKEEINRELPKVQLCRSCFRALRKALRESERLIQEEENEEAANQVFVEALAELPPEVILDLIALGQPDPQNN